MMAVAWPGHGVQPTLHAPSRTGMLGSLFSKKQSSRKDIANQHQLERALEGELETADLLRVYMLYIVFPLWLLVGVLDYAAHRKSRIEETAGTTESIIHSIMLMLAGAPVMLG